MTSPIELFDYIERGGDPSKLVLAFVEDPTVEARTDPDADIDVRIGTFMDYVAAVGCSPTPQIVYTSAYTNRSVDYSRVRVRTRRPKAGQTNAALQYSGITVKLDTSQIRVRPAASSD